jgi:hypothetical protein
MKNPVVVAKTGRTYEKAAIEAWIAINHTEPCDRRVTLEDFASTCSSNTGLYALVERFVDAAKRLKPGALLDGTVAARMKAAALKTTVVVVEHNVHVFKKQPSMLRQLSKTLSFGLAGDGRAPALATKGFQKLTRVMLSCFLMNFPIGSTYTSRRWSIRTNPSRRMGDSFASTWMSSRASSDTSGRIRI